MSMIFIKKPLETDIPCGFCGWHETLLEGVIGIEALRRCPACGQRQRNVAWETEIEMAFLSRAVKPPCAITDYKTL